MTGFTFDSAVLVIGYFILAFSLVTACVLYLRYNKKRILDRKLEQIRPGLLEAIAVDELSAEVLDELAQRHRRELVDLTWKMIPRVRGVCREVMLQWLEHTGELAIEQTQLQSRRSLCRARAASRLGLSGHPELAPLIVPMLGDRDAQLRIVAARAIARLGNPVTLAPLLNSLCAKRSIPHGVVVMALQNMSSAMCNEVQKCLSTAVPEVRQVCVQLLGMHGGVSAQRALALVAEGDANGHIRRIAIDALGKIATPICTASLRRVAQHAVDERDRRAAIRSLTQIGGSESMTTIIQLINVTDVTIAHEAVRALTNFGDEGWKALLAISTADIATSNTAKESLAHLTNTKRESQQVRTPESIA